MMKRSASGKQQSSRWDFEAPSSELASSDFIHPHLYRVLPFG